VNDGAEEAPGGTTRAAKRPCGYILPPDWAPMQEEPDGLENVLLVLAKDDRRMRRLAATHADGGGAAKGERMYRGRRGGVSAKTALSSRQLQFTSLVYKSKKFAQIVDWMKKYPANVVDVEALAAAAGWDGFTIGEDVLQHGKDTQPHVLLGFCPQKKAVLSFCTLDTGGSLCFEDAQRYEGYVKIGNLLSSGTGNGTAKGMIEYVEHVVQQGEKDIDKLIIADVERANEPSRRAFEKQGFQELEHDGIKVKCGGRRRLYAAATPDDCILVRKRVE